MIFDGSVHISSQWQQNRGNVIWSSFATSWHKFITALWTWNSHKNTSSGESEPFCEVALWPDKWVRLFSSVTTPTQLRPRCFIVVWIPNRFKRFTDQFSIVVYSIHMSYFNTQTFCYSTKEPGSSVISYIFMREAPRLMTMSLLLPCALWLDDGATGNRDS